MRLLPTPPRFTPQFPSIVSFSGDLLGQSLNGLGDLLQMPYGCGEQNMLNFAPDVYILKYLTIKGQATGSIANSALKFLNAGTLWTLQHLLFIDLLIFLICMNAFVIYNYRVKGAL